MSRLSETQRLSVRNRSVPLVAGIALLFGAIGLAIWGSELVGVFEIMALTQAQLPWAGSPGLRYAMVGGFATAAGLAFACRQMMRGDRGSFSTAGRWLVIVAGLLLVVSAGLVLKGVADVMATFQVLARSEAVPRAEELQLAVGQAESWLRGGWGLLVLAALGYLVAVATIGLGSPDGAQRGGALVALAAAGCAAGVAFGVAWLLAWWRSQQLQVLLSGAAFPSPADLAGRLNSIGMSGFLLAILLAVAGLSLALCAVMTPQRPAE